MAQGQNQSQNPKSSRGNSARTTAIPAPSGGGSGSLMPQPAATGGFLAGKMPTTHVEHTNRPTRKG